MNVYGFTIKSSRFSDYSTYLVFANDENEANNKINIEAKSLLSEKEGWIWGTPSIVRIEETALKELKNANIIW